MEINVQNGTDLPNKYIRYIKWKIYQLKEKFDHLIYAEIFLKTEGNLPKKYQVSIRLGVPGNDIFIKNRSENVRRLMYASHRDAYRYLAKFKSMDN